MSMKGFPGIQNRAQKGQGMTEYIVVAAALVFTFLAPITPPSVPDWASDGVGTRRLQCPENSYISGSPRPEQCTVVEVLAEVLRKRNDGYTYAISSTFYPERAVSISTDIFGDPEDPGTGNGDPGDPGGSAGDAGEVEPDFGIDSDTGQTVAVNEDEEVIGKVNSTDGCVENDAGVIIGKQVGTEVWKTDALCQLVYEQHTHDGSTHEHHTVIGTVGGLQTNGEVLDEDGNVIGTTSASG